MQKVANLEKFEVSKVIYRVKSCGNLFFVKTDGAKRLINFSSLQTLVHFRHFSGLSGLGLRSEYLAGKEVIGRNNLLIVRETLTTF